MSVAVPLPVKVKVGVLVPDEKAIDPELPNVKAPVPDASMVAPLAPMVNRRSVVSVWPDVPPVYCNVPLLITKLAAELVDCPIPLDVPPFARVATDKMPPLIVVAPVYVLVPERV